MFDLFWIKLTSILRIVIISYTNTMTDVRLTYWLSVDGGARQNGTDAAPLGAFMD